MVKEVGRKSYHREEKLQVGGKREEAGWCRQAAGRKDCHHRTPATVKDRIPRHGDEQVSHTTRLTRCYQLVGSFHVVGAGEKVENLLGGRKDKGKGKGKERRGEGEGGRDRSGAWTACRGGAQETPPLRSERNGEPHARFPTGGTHGTNSRRSRALAS